MPTYYDHTTLQDLNVDETTEAFIVANNNGTYFLRLVPAGILQDLSCDMLSRQRSYWPVSLPLTSPDKIEGLFPNGELRGAPLSYDEVVAFFELDPRNVLPSRFNNQVDEQVSTELRELIAAVLEDRQAPAMPVPAVSFVARLNKHIYSHYRNGLNGFFTPFNSRDSFGSVFDAYFENRLNRFFFSELTAGLICNNLPFVLNFYLPSVLAISAIIFTGFAALSAIYAAKSVIEFTLSKSDQASESLEFSSQSIKAGLAVPAFLFLSSIFDTLILLTRVAATLVNGKIEEPVGLVNASLY
jgi:hypothetical protein